MSIVELVLSTKPVAVGDLTKLFLLLEVVASNELIEPMVQEAAAAGLLVLVTIIMLVLLVEEAAVGALLVRMIGLP